MLAGLRGICVTAHGLGFKGSPGIPLHARYTEDIEQKASQFQYLREGGTFPGEESLTEKGHPVKPLLLDDWSTKAAVTNRTVYRTQLLLPGGVGVGTKSPSNGAS